MTNEEWAKMLKEHLDLLDEKIQAAAHREFFQEDCKCENCAPCAAPLARPLTVRKLLQEYLDQDEQITLAVDGYRVSGDVDALCETLGGAALEAVVTSISLDDRTIWCATEEAENDG